MSAPKSPSVLDAALRVNSAVEASGGGDPILPVVLHAGIDRDSVETLLKSIRREAHGQMKQHPHMCPCLLAESGYLSGILMGWYLAQEAAGDE